MEKRTRSSVQQDLVSEEAAAELEELVSAGVTPGFARVVHKVHTIDFEGEYDSLVKHLDPDPARMEFAISYAYADSAESRARKALQLMAVARIEQKSFEHQKAKRESVMRREAMAVLQAEKDAGTRSKQITDADVKSMMVEMNDKELAALEEESQKVANVVDVCTDLVKVAHSRCKTAQTMLSTVRK